MRICIFISGLKGLKPLKMYTEKDNLIPLWECQIFISGDVQ